VPQRKHNTSPLQRPTGAVWGNNRFTLYIIRNRWIYFLCDTQNYRLLKSMWYMYLELGFKASIFVITGWITLIFVVEWVALVSYSGSPGFKSVTGDHLWWQTIFVVLLSPSRKGQDCACTRSWPFPSTTFPVHYPIIRRDSVGATDRVV
jgi:hypothetical protein